MTNFFIDNNEANLNVILQRLELMKHQDPKAQPLQDATSVLISLLEECQRYYFFTTTSMS